MIHVVADKVRLWKLELLVRRSKRRTDPVVNMSLDFKSGHVTAPLYDVSSERGHHKSVNCISCNFAGNVQILMMHLTVTILKVPISLLLIRG